MLRAYVGYVEGLEISAVQSTVEADVAYHQHLDGWTEVLTVHMKRVYKPLLGLTPEEWVKPMIQV